MLYITKQEAIASGLTHEGTLYGVPAWFGEDDGHICMATPKIPALTLWCLFADACYELASYFLKGHQVLHSPIHIQRAIK
jgi:hypothetical protein